MIHSPKKRYLVALAVAFLILWNLPPRSVNFNHLEKLLASGDWQLADQETQRIITIQASGKNAFRRTTYRLFNLELNTDEELRKLPCQDLLTLDQLWVKHSHKLFGFSIQQSIWNSLYAEAAGDHFGNRENQIRNVYLKFSNQVAWREDKAEASENKSTSSNVNIPKGYFPSLLRIRSDYKFEDADQFKVEHFFQRIRECYLKRNLLLP